MRHRRFIAFMAAATMLAGSVTASLVNSPYQPPYFAFSPESRAHLTYYRIENRFDSAVVSFMVGEFALAHGSAKHRLVVATNDLQTTTYFQDDTGMYRDDRLANRLRTQVFEVPGETTSISFFRMPRVQSTCSAIGTGSGSQQQDGDAPTTEFDWHFAPGRDVLLDDTWLTIELVRASDDVRIATLDSVGVRGRPQSRFAEVYGTSPFSVVRTVTMPPLPAGTEVYIRVVPHRVGPSPHGCTAHLYQSWLNLSATNGYYAGEYSIMLRSDPRKQVIDSLYWNACLSFYDGLLETRGCVLPHERPMYMLSAFHDSVFNHRYYDAVTVFPADSSVYIVHPRPCSSTSKTRIVPDSRTEVTSDHRGLLSVSVPYVERGLAHVRIDASASLRDGMIRIVSLPSGRVLYSAKFSASSTLFESDIPITDLPSGGYSMQVTTADGRGAQCPFQVVR